ncbi:MarC family protein [Candidatus Woesearchaeota archaeon]|nr:MarC family protein [Candidatus Woesearchaeota archaeon]
MLESLIPLIVLFTVIFDPPASLAVFFVATEKMKDAEKKRIAGLAILVAAALSFGVLLLGQQLLDLFSTTLADFRVAGGLVLILLGIKMVTGGPLANVQKFKNNTGAGIAAVIGTPLLTGPAAITAILVSINDYGRALTALAVLVVLIVTGLLLYFSSSVHKYFGRTAIQITTTVLGLITIAWGVKMIRIGLGI